MINMRLPLRPAVPPPGEREMLLFGGPLDGVSTVGDTPPDGYRDFSGVLCVWREVRIDLMPFWSGHDFKRQVDHWRDVQGE